MIDLDQLPTLGFGLWKIPKEITAETVYQAIKAGTGILTPLVTTVMRRRLATASSGQSLMGSFPAKTFG